MRTSRFGRLLASSAALLAALALASCSNDKGDAAGREGARTTLAVVGTSDVADSNLFTSVLKPGFEKAYPQYDVTYQGNATQQAMDYAKTGRFGALLVHAASLENQFVRGGYSLEPYGRAIFWGDFVLLGPAGDPAGVMSGGRPGTDPAAAFAKIAAAGEAGKAHLVARETGAGTDVTSHKIWAAASGVKTCTVSDADGGGARPSTTRGDCDSSSPAYPSWYTVTGAKQAANIEYADTCSPAPSEPDCYVLTDRGTYDYLRSTHAISRLAVVVEGSSQLLVNSFHAYAINPDKVSGISDDTERAAKAFLDWLTSPAAQRAVGAYLADTGDAPFRPDATPVLSVDGTFPRHARKGRPLTVTGTLRNGVPGTPALVGQRLTLKAGDTTVARAKTRAHGRFTIRGTATGAAAYTLSSGPITQVEDAQLDPPFGDLLQPAELTLGGSRTPAPADTSGPAR